MKRFCWLLATLLSLAGLAEAQTFTTSVISAQKLLNVDKTPLNGTVVITLTDASDNPVTYTPQGGSPSTATFTANVVKGQIQPVSGFPYAVPAAATTTPAGIVYRVQTKNASNTVVLTLPKTSILSQYYSLDGYIAQAGNPISGTGIPTLPRCAPGAQYTDTTASAVAYACTSITNPDNTTVWTQNPSQNPMCPQAIAYPLTQSPYCMLATQAYLLPGYGIGNSGSAPAPATASPAISSPIQTIQANGTPVTPSGATINLAGSGVSASGNTVNISSGAAPAGSAYQYVGYNAANAAAAVTPFVGGSAVAPYTAVNFPVPGVQMPTTGWTVYDAFGDSYTFGVGASPNTLGYAYLIANATGNSGTFNNHGVGGDEACDTANVMLNSINPGAASTGLTTTLVGFNDSTVAGPGAYEAVTQGCWQTLLLWPTTPSTMKYTGASFGSVPTNWALDTTYSQVTGLTTTTNGATATWPVTTTVSAQPIVIFYEVIDGGTGSFSYSDGGSTYNATSYTVPAVSTFNGANHSVQAVVLNDTTAAPGTRNVITTSTSTGQTTILAVAALTSQATSFNNTWFGGVPRQKFDINSVTTRKYDELLRGTIASLQSQGAAGINFISTRSCLTATATDMSAADFKHPNNLGHQELANCFLAPPSQPQITPPVDASVSTLDTITTTIANCAISPSSRVVRFFSNTSNTCTMPVPNTYALPNFKKIVNEGVGPVTLNVTGNGNSNSSTSNTITLNQFDVVELVSVAYSRWLVANRYNTFQDICVSVATSTTITAKNHCYLVSGTGTAITFTTPVNVGDRYNFINTSTTQPVTFTNGSLTVPYLNPGEGMEIEAVTTTGFKVLSQSFTNGYDRVTNVSASSYTVLATDQSIQSDNPGNTAFTLPTTLPPGKRVTFINHSSSTGTFSYTGASGGNVTSQTTGPAHSLTIETGTTAGYWHVVSSF